MKYLQKNGGASNEKAKSIGLCLLQLEKEARECGLEFSAQLIRAAALSLEGPITTDRKKNRSGA